MDPLIFDVEVTLRSLSLKKDSYLSAYQSFLIIKDSVISRNGLCSVPILINLTFETINGYLSENEFKYIGHNVTGNDRTLNGLMILLKRLLEVLDIDLLGVNYSVISQIIIKQIVDIISVILKNKMNVEVDHLVSALKQLCSIIDDISIKPQILMKLLEIFVQMKLSDRQRLNIQDCIFTLLNITPNCSSITLSTHKFIMFHISGFSRKQLEIEYDFSENFEEQIMKSLNLLYSKLISRFYEYQIKEYLDILVLFSTSRKYRHISFIALDCLSNQAKLLETNSHKIDYIWIPIYILKKLINSVQIMRDITLIRSFISTCNTCLITLVILLENNDNQTEIQNCFDDFIHLLRQFIFTIEFEVHLIVLNSIFEFVQNIKKLTFNQRLSEFKLQRLDFFQLLISKLLPLLSSMLEDYKYKLSWASLVNLFILIIDFWDESSITRCFHDENTRDSFKKERLRSIKLFENIITSILNMASISLCGDICEKNPFVFNDVSNMKEELRRAVGSITRTFGPQVVLKLKPLVFDGIKLTDPKFPMKSNSWLLPLLRIYITRTELSYFVDNLLPIALKLNTYSSEVQESEPNHAKLYKILEEQIWSLLPGFFDEALDFSDTFGSKDGILRTYMIQLLDKTGTRDHICNSLLKISKQAFIGKGLSLKNGDEFYEAQKLCNLDNRKYYIAQKTWECNVDTLNLYSKTFLSLLVVKFLNCHPEEDYFVNRNSQVNIEQESQHYLNCIQALVPFCEETILQNNLRNFHIIWSTLTNSAEKSKLPFSFGKTIALLDVVTAMIKRLNLDQIKNIIMSFTTFLKVIITEDSRRNLNEKIQLEKKLYKGLKVSLDTLRLRKQTFLDMKDQISDLWYILALDNGKCPASSLKHRLSCLRVFIQILNKIEDKEFVNKFGYENIVDFVISESLLSIREFNTIVRTNALTLLKSLIECYLENDKFLETIIIKIITISRINMKPIDSDYLTVPCITVLSRLVIDYGDVIKKANLDSNTSLLKVIFDFIICSLNNQDPLIYSNTLKFVKIFISRLDCDLWNFIPNILFNILKNENCALKHRIQVKKTLIFIIKKFGFEKTLQVFPKEHTRLYRYLVRKIKRSTKRRNKTSIGKDEENLYKNTNIQNNMFVETNQEYYNDVDSDNAYGGILISFEEDDDYLTESDSDLVTREQLKSRELKYRNFESRSELIENLANLDRSLAIVDDSCTNTSTPVDLLSSEASSKVISINLNKNCRNNRDILEDKYVEFDKRINKIIVKDEHIQEQKVIDSTDTSLKTGFFEPNIKKFDLKLPKTVCRSSKRARKQHIVVKSSKEFKNRRARGDIVRNGQQPFAYLRLNPALSREKHRLNATKSFANVFSKRR